MYKGKNNGWLTQSIFYEMWLELYPQNRHADPVFSLYKPRPGLIDCKTTFVEMDDVTGYDWAMKYLESYDHWLYLLDRQWFAKAYEVWKNELQAKLKARALRRITELTTSTNEAQALAASKYLAERGWEKAGRGRPSKDEVKGEMKRLITQAETLDADAQRIGLTVIQGGKG